VPAGAVGLVVSAAPGAGRLPIAPARVLLAEQAGPLERVRALSACSAVQFEAVYAPLLSALADYVQRLPCARQPEQTILHARLRAAERALARRRGAILPPDAGSERVAREADLWTYAVFSLALLRRLAREFAPWSIVLWSAHDRPLGRWQPRSAPCGLAGVKGVAAYSLRPETGPPGADWTPLVAGALLPGAALNWLWREPGVMSVWQQALSSDLPPEIAPLFADS
jgi:hypothetical protein